LISRVGLAVGAATGGVDARALIALQPAEDDGV
jgi:hypothetical protein